MGIRIGYPVVGTIGADVSVSLHISVRWERSLENSGSVRLPWSGTRDHVECG